ncbi:MAG: protein-L-isoaspartate(D-aspartate) O-methyltransferase [Candidatus Diapherotrites archaeon]|nr:protein-L-isoaspartate(D-aspartate) O-methyltransferase [Candidatus Diapherotrites archaeon]
MDFESQRKKLVNSMIANGSLKSAEIIKAFLKVKREEFFLPELKKFSYDDSAYPIGHSQTISQPSTIAIMLELLKPLKGHKVLEIGSGSGYVLALLSEIVGPEGKVIGIERNYELAVRSIETLAKLKYKKIKVLISDGSKGLPEEAPFHRILVSAACNVVPKPLEEQLTFHGRIVAPVGSKFSQQLQVIEKEPNGALKRYFAEGYFVFVPLVSDS